MNERNVLLPSKTVEPDTETSPSPPRPAAPARTLLGYFALVLAVALAVGAEKMYSDDRERMFGAFDSG